MNIITISGVDGSGKSTQVKMLRDYLEKQGKRVFYFHGIEFSIATKIAEFKGNHCPICKLTGKCNKEKSPKKRKSITKSGFLGIQLRKIFLCIDIIRFHFLLSKKKKQGIDFILSDRYFFDTVININYLARKKVFCLAENFIPQPNLKIFLKTDPQAIMSRERKPEQGLQYLQEKTQTFQRKKQKWNLTEINGNQEKEVVFEKIKNLLTRIN